MGAQRPYYEETDWVKMSLAMPFEYEPRTKFVYSNVGPYLAGVLVQRRAGCFVPRVWRKWMNWRDEWVYSQILSFGPSAKVLAPKEVAEEMKRRINEMMGEKYTGGNCNAGITGELYYFKTDGTKSGGSNDCRG